MNYTLQEIENQPRSWDMTLQTIVQQWRSIVAHLPIKTGTHFVFTGCGTSYYLSQSAARLFQEMTGYLSIAVPASELFLADISVIPQGVPVIVFAISRSGTTSEVIMAVQYIHENFSSIPVIGMTCHSGSELAQLANYTLILDHAAERSVVMTQSFTSMLLALQWVATEVGNCTEKQIELKKLPQIASTCMNKFLQFGKCLATDASYESYIFLGLGAYYGLAAEATLKLKEMTQIPCEYYNPMEFRHGPISIVTENSLVISITGNSHQDKVLKVLEDVSLLGGNVAAIWVKKMMNFIQEQNQLLLPSEISDWSRTVLYMPALHYLAYTKALQLGLNPDTPRNLNQVVIL